MKDHDLSAQQLKEMLAAAQQRIDVLEHAEARYHALFENASDAIIIVETSTGQIIDVNANAARRLGYEPEELLRLNIQDVEAESEMSHGDGPFRWKSQSGVVIYECMYRRKDDSLWSTEVAMSLIRVGGETLQQNVIRDITERKEVERHRVQLAVERERVDILAEFINNVSHEFKTPISVINTSLYLLERTLTDETERERANLINDQIMYINHLIDAMLTMCQLDSRAEFSFAPCDVNEVLRDVLSGTRPLAENRQQQVQTTYSSDSLYVAGVKEDLYLAVYQLLDKRHQLHAGGWRDLRGNAQGRRRTPC